MLTVPDVFTELPVIPDENVVLPEIRAVPVISSISVEALLVTEILLLKTLNTLLNPAK
jgi:hypothetical protein